MSSETIWKPFGNNIIGNHLEPQEHMQILKACPLDGDFRNSGLDGGFHQLGKNSSTLLNVFAPLTSFHIRRNASCDSRNQELDLSPLDLDCNANDNPLAYIDDALTGELVALDAIDADTAKDSFAIFSCAHDFGILANSSLSSFGIDELNKSVDERVPPTTAKTFEQRRAQPESELDGLCKAEDFLLTKMDDGASIHAAEAVSEYAERPAEWNIFTERLNLRPLSSQHRTRQCERCEILCHVVHTNGLQDTRLEIHGCEGQNYHAVLQTRFCLNDGCPPTLEQHMVEFPVGNSEYVKQFLLQYSLLRRKEGFVLQQESPSAGVNAGYGMCSSDRNTSAVGLHHLKETGDCSSYPSFSG